VAAAAAAVQVGVLVIEEEENANNPLANPMMDPMNMVYVVTC